MRIAVTGSIASDHLMTFPGSFSEHLIEGHLDRVSLSFLADELEIRRGGVAANIGFGLGLLGLSPVLIGAVGADFTADHEIWLKQHGVDTSGVRVSTERHTARFVCTTDRDQNQIATFYAGAMAEARHIRLTEVMQRTGSFGVTIIGANDPEAMVAHTGECRDAGYPFLADPSQQLARADGGTVRTLVDGAAGLFTNEYERQLIQQKTGWTAGEILARVGFWVTTLGAKGAAVDRKGEDTVAVPAVPPRRAADPTGAGDAFRAGFMAGMAWDLGDERSSQLGCLLATLALESVGPQEYQLDRADWLARFAAAYGDAAAADIEPRLPAQATERQAQAGPGTSTDLDFR
jgi:adenosine kinase